MIVVELFSWLDRTIGRRSGPAAQEELLASQSSQLQRIPTLVAPADSMAAPEFGTTDSAVTAVAVRVGPSFTVSTGRGSHLYYATKTSVRFNLRQEGLRVDVKSGPNSYVIGPTSVRPDGVHYDFTGTELSLANLPEIHAPNQQRNTRHCKQITLLPEGQRNPHLITKAV